MDSATTIAQEAATQMRSYIKENMPKKYVYHDLEHTENVVTSCRELGEKYDLSEDEMAWLEIAAWFHDCGYVEDPSNHEKKGVEKARKFLTERNVPETNQALVEGMIMATKLPQTPQNLMERIICDADLNHLGKDSYWEHCVKLRQELMIAKNTIMQEDDWLEFELDFLQKHEYKTDIAEASWGKQKKKHAKQLDRLRKKLFPTEQEMLAKKKKKKREKQKNRALLASQPGIEIKQLSLGRGVETMYRATYRTHVNLSAMADNKANIMLSINAIIISILVSTLVPQLSSTPKLVVPTLMLLATCMGAIIYATLSTRPKVTEGKSSRDLIEQKKSNLLFFGNFYNMDLEDYHWGMMEMIKDEDFLYNSMTRDLYWLGKVLAQKYRLLSICYNIFMYGLGASVLGFVVVYTLF